MDKTSIQNITFSRARFGNDKKITQRAVLRFILRTGAELGTFEWWISGLMLDPLFFLNSRLNE